MAGVRQSRHHIIHEVATDLGCSLAGIDALSFLSDEALYVLPATNTAKLRYPVLNAVAMVSANDGWAVGGYQESDGGNHGFILHYDGTAWTMNAAQSAVPFSDVQMLSATDGWALTEDNDTSRSMYHFDGHTWASYPSPTIEGNAMLLHLSMVSATDGWIVASSTTGPSAPLNTAVLLHFQAGTWSIATTFANIEPIALSMVSAHDGWLTGWSNISPTVRKMVLLHDTNGHWEPVTTPLGNTTFMPLRLGE